MDNATETHYSVSGMKCGGCVAKATEVVSKLPGFIETRFDLAGKSAVIKGNVDFPARSNRVLINPGSFDTTSVALATQPPHFMPLTE